MNILIITSLYPNEKSQSVLNTSYAVHNFAKKWAIKHNVEVAKINIKSFENLNKGNIFSKDLEDFELDYVKIKRYNIWKFPKLDFSRFQINKLTNKIVSNNNRKYDVIICHMFYPSYLVSTIFKIKFGVPIVLTLHNSDILYIRKRKKRYLQLLDNLQFLNLILFRSNKIKTSFNNLINLNKLNITNDLAISGIENKYIIPNEVLNEKIHKTNTSFILVANMIPLKNIDIVITAFNKLNLLYSEITLKIIGDGPLRNKLIKKASGNQNIKFTGLLSHSQVLTELQKADVFVLVSSPETLGNVYFEALASGCIVIGSKDEGIDGIVIDNYNGFLCLPRDVEELYNLMKLSFNMNVKEKENMLMSARKTIVNMDQDTMADKYIKLIENSIRHNKN